MADFLGSALKAFGQAAPGLAAAALGPVGAIAGPVLGSVAGNVLSGFNQRAARKWEEDMYNQYNSPSALVRQYIDAGINPALMFGGQTPAAPTDTSAAPVVEPATGTVTEMLAQLMELSILDKRGRNLDSLTNMNNANAAGQTIENKFKPDLLSQQIKRGDVEIENVRYGIAESIARLNNIEQDTLNKQEEQYYIRAQKLLAIAQKVLADKQGQYIDSQKFEQEFSNQVLTETGNKPDTPVWNLLPGVAFRASQVLQNSVNNRIGFLKWLRDNSVFGYGKTYGNTD